MSKLISIVCDRCDKRYNVDFDPYGTSIMFSDKAAVVIGGKYVYLCQKCTGEYYKMRGAMAMDESRKVADWLKAAASDE